MTTANGPTRRQRILRDVFLMFADADLPVKTADQLVLIDRITTYVDTKIGQAEGESYHAGHMDGTTARRLEAEDAAHEQINTHNGEY